MSATPDPLDMLDVIEESRQRAMAQREAAVAHLATVALQAIVEGADVRDVARRCGFAMEAKTAADAIADMAADLATNPADYGETPIAYTWPDDGWSWEDCDPKDPGSVAFWQCEQKPKEAAK